MSKESRECPCVCISLSKDAVNMKGCFVLALIYTESQKSIYISLSKDVIYMKGCFVVALIYTVYSNSKFSNKKNSLI